jgi:hypothetical protein
MNTPAGVRRRRGSVVLRPGDNNTPEQLVNYEQRLRAILQDTTECRTAIVDMINRDEETLFVLDPGILRRTRDKEALMARLAGDPLWYVEESGWTLQDESGPGGLLTPQSTLLVHRLAQARLTSTPARIVLKLVGLGSGTLACFGLFGWMVYVALVS